MRKFCSYTLIPALLILSLLVMPGFSEDFEADFEPLSPEFLEWQAEHESDSSLPSSKNALPSSEYQGGYVPVPVDLSHLADNPPDEDDSPVPNRKADTIPAKYDLRNVGGKSYVTSIKSQLPYGTCWAHASIGAIESNMLMNGKGTYDLSEMHLAWFTFRNADKSKTFKNLGSSSLKSVLDQGGNSFYPTAMYARLDGPAYESEVPYGEGKQPSQSSPSAYTRVLRLRDVYYLNFGTEPNVNASDTARNIVKRRIMETGAVVGNYHNNNSSYYKTASGGTSYYYNSGSTNHAVQIIGWDDNYSRSNFKTNPGVDGAWLIKNSWDDEWWTGTEDVGDNGCFWMSYAQKLTEGSAFVAEEADSSMRVYDYAPLGWCTTWGYTSGTSEIYFANVFKAEEDGENLTEVSFYTPDNNISYEVSVYSGMDAMPSSSPVPSGRMAGASSASGTIAYAGYHTITLDTPVSLTEGEYFSVVVRFTNYTKIAAEKVVSSWSNNAVIDEGSFFSPNGTTWYTGKNYSINACVKAYTVTGKVSGVAPKIHDGYYPDGFTKQSYSGSVSASGTRPITWSANSKIPAGLTIDSSTGEISGTPTTAGGYTFSVTATNDYGSDTRYYTVNIWDTPVISADEVTGYVGYSLKHQMTLTPSLTATWSTSDTLPSGLSLSKSGLISGKPKKEGSYSATLKAVTTAGESSATVNFTINAKPVKPTIKISGMKAVMIGEELSHDIETTGTEPVTVTIEGQPSGISLTGATAYMTGTPTAAGTFSIKITATNIATELEGKPVTKTVKLTVKARPPVIESPDALAGSMLVMGEEYGGFQFNTSDGTDPITWSVSGQPSGMKMTASGFLYGTPSKAGSFKLTVKASNAGGNSSVKVPLTVLQKPAISTTKLANATTDKKYSAKISAKGSTPITWEVDGLPDTLSLTQNASGTTATISGTPTSADSYTLTLRATNEAGASEAKITLKVAGVAPKLTASLSRAHVGEEYEETRISATGTKPITITCAVSDSELAKLGVSSLEDLGLAFTNDPDSGTASLKGTPTISAKNLPITFKAVNSLSAASKTVKLTITGEKPTFTSPDSTVNILCAVNSEVALDFSVTGTPTITYSMTKASGFTLTQTGNYNAVLTGTAPAKDSSTTITITATNADGKATRKVVIKAQTPPSITMPSGSSSRSDGSVSLPDGTLNKSYSLKLSATGTKTIKWALEGDLPEGMKFANGTFSGKPKEAGDFAFTLTASNGIGEDARNFSLTVNDPNTETGSLPEIAPETKTEAAPESQNDPDTGTEAVSVEPAITFGVVREDALNQTELEGDGYIVAAVLPEVSVNVSGMYDIEAELSEDAPEGAVLYWLAFPDNEGSKDDTIAEFYDEAGAEIETVPAGRKVVVSVWLNEGVKYSPVIAVK